MLAKQEVKKSRAGGSGRDSTLNRTEKQNEEEEEEEEGEEEEKKGEGEEEAHGPHSRRNNGTILTMAGDLASSHTHIR